MLHKTASASRIPTPSLAIEKISLLYGFGGTGDSSPIKDIR
jgi:hypothetical protein